MTTEKVAVNVEKIRSKTNDFILNVQEQIQRKVQHAAKALLKIENNPEEIKIIPNSGNFKVLAEEVIKLKVGEEIKTKEAVATVTDQYQQTDFKGSPYLVETEFQVEEIASGCSNKAVMHTYLSRTFFMIQGKEMMKNKVVCKDSFF